MGSGLATAEDDDVRGPKGALGVPLGVPREVMGCARPISVLVMLGALKSTPSCSPSLSQAGTTVGKFSAALQAICSRIASRLISWCVCSGASKGLLPVGGTGNGCSVDMEPGTCHSSLPASVR